MQTHYQLLQVVHDPRYAEKSVPGSDAVQLTLIWKHSILLPLCNRGSTLPSQRPLEDDEALKRAPQILFPGELCLAADSRIMYLSGISFFRIYSPYELIKKKNSLGKAQGHHSNHPEDEN